MDNATKCLLLLLLSVFAFVNVSLWIYVHKESRLRHDVTVTRLSKTQANDAQLQVPILLMFTCFTREQGKAFIHTNTLRNWALFRPFVQPMLYTDYADGPFIKFAKLLGWYVMPVPKMSSIGVPYLKNMFLTAMKTHHSVLYGYVNGDILFTNGFIETLRDVVRHIDKLNTTMIVGRRTNHKINFKSSIPIYHLNDVLKLSRKGSLFATNAEDYFFVTADFPWRVIPDVVIGRPAYDNFLVGTAIKRNISVIDATKTIFALHQTGVDGNYAGHKRHDPNFNTKLIRKVIGKFNYRDGLTVSAQYQCERDFLGNVFIQKRPPKSNKSLKSKRKTKKGKKYTVKHKTLTKKKNKKRRGKH